MGNNLQVHWQLTSLVCLWRRRWCCVPGITYILRRPGWLVCAVSCPLLSSFFLCFPMASARLHAWQTNRCYLPCISSSGPLSLSTNSPLLAHRLQISPASFPLDKGQYQWQNIFYVWNVAHNKQSSIRFVKIDDPYHYSFNTLFWHCSLFISLCTHLLLFLLNAIRPLERLLSERLSSFNFNYRHSVAAERLCEAFFWLAAILSFLLL